MAMMRLPEVLKETGLSRTSIYRLMKNDDFPEPINLGPRAVAWVDTEIKEWIDKRIESARNGEEVA